MVENSWIQRSGRRQVEKTLACHSRRCRTWLSGEKNYLTFFQNDAFSRQAMKEKMPRNSNTQTPIRTRVF